MKTRSQRDSSIEAESADAGGHSLRDNKLRNIQWDCADVDHMELDVSTDTFLVFLKWPNGDVSEHPREEAKKYCPQQASLSSCLYSLSSKVRSLRGKPLVGSTRQKCESSWSDMISILPTEIICMIAKLCSLGGQASLSRSCRVLYSICKPILYRNDVANHRSSSVFHSIVHCRDQSDALKILASAKEGGADFIKCQDARKSHPLSFYRIDATLYSPLHLAARRGLDDIVAYLIDHGLDVDDNEGVSLSRKSPLMEAILNHQEPTAVLMVRRGASRGLCPSNLEAFQATIREGLTCLVRVIVERNGLDVNAELGYGCSPLVLAVCHRRGPMIPTLLELGARALPAMQRFCSDNAFLSILWMLDSGSTLFRESLEIDEMLELIFSIATERVSPAQKNQQVLALERLLEVLQDRQTLGTTIAPSAQEFSDFLDALLQMVLSTDHTDTRLADLFLSWGAKIQTGVFLQLSKILGSPRFTENTGRCLRQNPGLLHCFDFVHHYSLHRPIPARGWAIRYFVNRVPNYAIRLVQGLKQHNLPLTRRGVEMLDLFSLEKGIAPG